MKKIGYSGVAYVVSHSRHMVLQPGITFPKGGAGSTAFPLRTGTSGIFYWFLKARDLQGNHWWYPYITFGSVPEFNRYVDAVGNVWQLPSQFFCIGIAYNGLWRPATFDKIADADINAWLSAH